jgi:hypothetical protein
VARYDRVIPPGGTGKITLTIDTNLVRGMFRKKTVVWSNDLDRRSIALYLTGEVKPHISLEPDDFLSLMGAKGKVPQRHIDIINNTKGPVKITKIDNFLTDHIILRLKEVKPGYIYRIEVEDISPVAGDYFGHLVIKTDSPDMPELIIMIKGQISG